MAEDASVQGVTGTECDTLRLLRRPYRVPTPSGWPFETIILSPALARKIQVHSEDVASGEAPNTRQGPLQVIRQTFQYPLPPASSCRSKIKRPMSQ